MKKTAFLTVLSVLFLSAVLLPSLCQALTVGVQVGDWFKYEGELVSWEADPAVPIPPNEYATEVVTYNTTDWFKYTVTAINGENVTFEVVTHWTNGSETTETLEEDMANSFTLMCIDTDLGPGDVVRAEYDWSAVFGFAWIWPARTLNASTDDPYVGGTRTANVLDWWHPPFFEGADPTTRQIYHWDEATGIQTLYETQTSGDVYSEDFSELIGSYSYVTRRVLVDSSVEGLVVPEVFTAIVMLVILGASTVSIVL